MTIPIVRRLLASYTLILVKHYHAGLNTLRTPFELGEPKLDKNCRGMCWSSRPVREFSAENHEVCCKKPFGNRLRVSTSEIDLCEFELEKSMASGNYLSSYNAS